MRILVTEDDAALAEALRFSLTQAGYAVDCASNGIAADESLKASVFALLILDIGLPKLDGYEVLRRVRRRHPSLPVLILSAREAPDEKAMGLDLGADDYLAKPFSLTELLARVRALLRRAQGGGAPVTQYGGLSYDSVGRVASLNGRALQLSSHEIGVLEVLLHRFGQVVSKETLVEQLYAYDRDVGYNAIEVYIHRLRKKIDGSGLNVRTVYGRGYVVEQKDAAA